jgi:uncharacterized protein GlcG (DUF336 family)
LGTLQTQKAIDSDAKKVQWPLTPVKAMITDANAQWLLPQKCDGCWRQSAMVNYAKAQRLLTPKCDRN